MHQVMVAWQNDRRYVQPGDSLHETQQDIVGNPFVIEHVTHQKQHVATLGVHRVRH